MISPTHNLRFSSRINIVLDEQWLETVDYEKLKATYQTADIPWKIADRVSLATEAATQGASICNAGGITNGLKTTLFHLCPYSHLWNQRSLLRKARGSSTDEGWHEIKKTLENDIEQLKKDNPQLRAFLTGGKSGDRDSVRLRDCLAKLFKNADIPFSILWGSASPSGLPIVNIHYEATSDTWTVQVENAEVESPKALQQTFSKIHIDDGDELFINGKKVSPKEVNQA